MSLFDNGVPPLAVTPSAQAPVANVSAMPDFAPPPPAQPMPGLFTRVKNRVSNNLFRAPSGLGDLVSPDEISAARQQGLLSMGIALTQGGGENALQSLGRGLAAAQQGFHGALENTVAQKEQQVQMAAQVAQQNKLKMHAQLAMQFAPRPNETTEQAINRLTQYASAMASFDPQAASQLSDTVSKLREPASTNSLHSIDAGGHVITTDRTGKTVRDDTKTESAADRRAAAAAARAQSSAEARDQRDERRQQNVILQSFNNDKVVKDYHGAEAAYSVLNAARQPGGKNFMRPMAALDAFARMLNPMGAVRQGTLQILKDQGSLGQKIARNWSMLSKGEWPAGMQNEVFQMADAIMQQHAEDFDNFRNETKDRAAAQGLDPDAFEKMLYHRRQIEAPKYTNTGKLGSYTR